MVSHFLRERSVIESFQLLIQSLICCLRIAFLVIVNIGFDIRAKVHSIIVLLDKHFEYLLFELREMLDVYLVNEFVLDLD